MQIGIVDADLIGRKKHKFPNIVCEKISGFYKREREREREVSLLLNYDFDCNDFDRVYISKVFTDTYVPDWVVNDQLRPENVLIGGTGFYFDKAPNLPEEIEHQMPDYHLYDDWIKQQEINAIQQAEKSGKIFKQQRFKTLYKEYTDYSMGFLTRGCFRKCKFCVNQKYDHVFPHAPLSEFYDPARKKICLLDDNFFGCPQWKELLRQVKYTDHPFKFKQGMDARILNDEKCSELFTSKYDGDLTFAFDNISDYELIENKINLIKKYTDKRLMFYVFCGFDRFNHWDNTFWYNDIIDVFRRIELLMKYKCLPYIMRFNRYEESPFRGVYISLARWCNQPNIFKRKSFTEFCIMEGGAAQRYLDDFVHNTNIKYEYPQFLTMKWEL